MKYATGKEKTGDNEMKRQIWKETEVSGGRQRAIKHISNKMYYWYKQEFLYRLKILKEYETKSTRNGEGLTF